MKSSQRGLRGSIATALLLVAAAGCSTVIRNDAAREAAAGAEERAALREAAAEMAKAPWPKTTSSTLSERLAGTASDADEMSRDDAVDVYLRALAEKDDAQAALLADADRHVASARAFAAAAQEASQAPDPRLSDVSLVEDAISTLRETRAIYVASLKKLDGDEQEIDAVKSSFDDLIKSLGDVADDLAEKAMKRTSLNFDGATVNRVAGGF